MTFESVCVLMWTIQLTILWYYTEHMSQFLEYFRIYECKQRMLLLFVNLQLYP